MRHALNLESGLNDGLALPFVLFFIILASPGGDAGSEAAKLVGEAAFGAVLGVLLGLGAGRLTHHLPGGGIVRRYEGIYALGVGLLAYGIADVTFGNGLIAAFVCGISLAVAEHDIADDFVVFSENVSSILQVLTFFAFGGLIVATGYHEDIPLLVAFIAFALVIARPVAITLSFVRVGLPAPHRAFIAWFGPKGVAGILFAELVLNSDVGDANLIFETAAFVILASIVVHGLTDTLGARWIERRVSGGYALRSFFFSSRNSACRQDALLLQLAEPLEPVELGVVGIRRPRLRGPSPPTRSGGPSRWSRPPGALPHRLHPVALLGAGELASGLSPESLEADPRQRDQQQGEHQLARTRRAAR